MKPTHKTFKNFIEEKFKTPGSTNNFWLPTTHKDASDWLDDFIKNKLNLFGDYEDAVSQRDNILFHSALSPLINIGLITPQEIINRLKKYKGKISINSLEDTLDKLLDGENL